MRLLLSSAKLKSVSTTLSAVAMSFMVSACGPNLGGFLPRAMDPAVKKSANQTPSDQPKVTTDDPKPTATPSLQDFEMPSGPRSSSVPLPTEPTTETPTQTLPQDLPDAPPSDVTTNPVTPSAPTSAPTSISTSPSTPAAPAAPATPSSPAAPSTPAAPSPTPGSSPAPSVKSTPKPSASTSATPAVSPSATPAASPTPTVKVTRPPLQHELAIPATQQGAAIAVGAVDCEKSDVASCPNNVAMLILRTKTGLEQCTSFLIGDSMMMTNSHCVPDEIKTVGADCSAYMQIFFPASGAFAAETVSCKTILRASKITASDLLTPDYAVFSINRTVSRPPLTLNRVGLPDNLALRVFSVEPRSKTEIKGLLRAKDCATAQGTIATPGYTQDLAPVGDLDACTIIPGNSGSPAIDANGQVRAIVHAAVKPLSGDDIKRAGYIPAVQSFNPVGFVTNIACADVPAENRVNGGAPAAACSNPSLSRNGAAQQTVASFDDKAFLPLIRTWEATTPKAMKFALDHITSTQHDVMPQLYCVQNPSTWLDPNASKDVTLSYTTPIWSPVKELDASYRLRLVPTEIDEDSVSIHFDADRLAKTGSAVGSMVSTDRSTRQSTAPATFVVVLCK